MTNPDIPHPAMRGFPFGLGLADNSGGAKTLKPKCVLVAITFLALMSVTPAFAAPRETEGFCFEQSQHVVLPLRRGAWGKRSWLTAELTLRQRQPESASTAGIESASVSA